MSDTRRGSDTRLEQGTTEPMDCNPQPIDSIAEPIDSIAEPIDSIVEPTIQGIRPSYYSPESPYEARKVIRAWGAGFNLGNVLKYVSRAGKKTGARRLDDLQKAATYLQFEIEEEREEQGL